MRSKGKAIPYNPRFFFPKKTSISAYLGKEIGKLFFFFTSLL